MKKNWHRVLAALLGVMMCLTLSLPSVLADDIAAEEKKDPAVAIPVTIELTGDHPKTDDTFEVVLKAKNGAPMPEGSEKGMYTLEIEGEDTVSFPEIVYTRVGIYEYTIVQREGDNKYVDYDETVYEVTVYITNREGGGFDVTVVAYEKGGEDKCEVEFENRYDYPSVPVIPPPETKPETKPEKPKPVETEAPETIPAETEPEETEPEETDPEETEPEETEPETEPEPETETELPEPEEILVQTGQLNWPISVLSIGGMGFVAVGCVFLSGKHREAEDREEDGE
ncbi:MAG: hypothetical protein IJP32_03740 [Clostridia bacterium]|nr:hypothetical protein [Clostridia bacterium]MBQ9995458.1 hypothetical protein [Clostridia bacterium]